MNIYIIGAGGVGSWLAPAVCLLVRPKNVVLIDPDILEDKNLNRQLFTKKDLGKGKAYALADKYGCRHEEGWYFDGKLELESADWLLACVDNHPARRSVLASCDQSGCRAILGGNETTSAEAFYYQPDWKGSPLDPRIYYPDISTSEANDPRAGAIGCTGEAQSAKPQLVTANLMAASLMGHLLAAWHLEAGKLSKEARVHLPFHLLQNLSSTQTKKVIDYASARN